MRRKRNDDCSFGINVTDVRSRLRRRRCRTITNLTSLVVVVVLVLATEKRSRASTFFYIPTLLYFVLSYAFYFFEWSDLYDDAGDIDEVSSDFSHPISRRYVPVNTSTETLRWSAAPSNIFSSL